MAEVLFFLVLSTYGEESLGRSLSEECTSVKKESRARTEDKTAQVCVCVCVCVCVSSDVDMGLRVRAGKFASPLDTLSSLVMR